MKKISLILLIVILPLSVWAGGKKDPAGSDVGIEDPKDGKKEKRLLELVESGDAEAVESLLKIDINLDEADESGRTALHAAAETGDADIVAILLIRGAKIDPVDDTGRTPLFLAVESEKSESVKVLAAAGADPAVKDKEGRSPASIALTKPAISLASLLTETNINRNVIDGAPLLHAASAAGLVEHVKVLIASGADVNLTDSKDQRALDVALLPTVTLEKVECAAELLRNAAPLPQNQEWRYIVQPIRTGNLEVRSDYGSTALHTASDRGHEGMVRYLIANGAEIDARDQPGNTPLHVSVRRGYRTIATLLLNQKSDVNAQDYNGNAPIHESLTANDGFAITSMLLERGADPNVKNGSGTTPLHLTVLLASDVTGATLLMDRGAMVDPRDRAGNTPLLLAVEAGHREFCELFLSRNADIFARNNKGKTPTEGALGYGSTVTSWFFKGSRLSETDNSGRGVLHFAVELASSNDTIRVLLTAGSSPNLRDSRGETPLHYAAARDFLPQAITLLEGGADPFIESNEGVTPLLTGFKLGPEKTVQMLANRINMADTWGNTALFHAIIWKYPMVVEALLNAGADARHRNKRGGTALHEAVRVDSAAIAALLLKFRAEPNAGDSLGRTPLHDAVTWGSPDMVKFLAANGADLDARDKTGQTAIHMSAFSGNNSIVKWLLETGASPDVRDNNGRTPLFIAAESDRTDTAALLLQNGAGLNLRDNYGRTALHSALASGRTSVSKFLLDAGSDIFAVDAAGTTPLDLALAGGTAFLTDFMDKNLVNRQDNRGNTALHLAVQAGYDEAVIRVLLGKGADRKARNAMGKTPADLARDRKNDALASLLM